MLPQVITLLLLLFFLFIGFFAFLFIHFIFDCAGSSLLLRLFSSCDKPPEATLHSSVGFSLWRIGSRAPELPYLQHVGAVVAASKVPSL